MGKRGAYAKSLRHCPEDVPVPEGPEGLQKLNDAINYTQKKIKRLKDANRVDEVANVERFLGLQQAARGMYRAARPNEHIEEAKGLGNNMQKALISAKKMIDKAMSSSSQLTDLAVDSNLAEVSANEIYNNAREQLVDHQKPMLQLQQAEAAANEEKKKAQDWEGRRPQNAQKMLKGAQDEQADEGAAEPMDAEEPKCAQDEQADEGAAEPMEEEEPKGAQDLGDESETSSSTEEEIIPQEGLECDQADEGVAEPPMDGEDDTRCPCLVVGEHPTA